MSAGAGARARRPVAVLLSRFPSVTETFILREVTEMERQGQPVRLVPLLRESPPVVHPEAMPWVERAMFTPFLSRALVASNARLLLRRPGPYLGLLLRLVAASLVSPRFLAATLALWPKYVHLARRLEDEGVRHVHAHFGSHPATAALVASSLTDATFSVTVHAHDLFMRRYRPFLGTKLSAAAFVRVISAFNRRELLARYPSLAPEKVHVVHVGVDPEPYAPCVEATDGRAPAVPGGGDAAAPAGEVRILSVASLRPYKGPTVLVEACRRLRDEGVSFRCDFVGDGPLREALERRIAEADLEDRVRLAGAETQDAVARRLRERPIVVHPSVVQDDGMKDGIPVALMEAMAAGAPVVASRLSGIPELIEDGVSGILVEPDDPGALASAIRRLAEDAELAHRMGAAATRRVRADFSLEACTAALLRLIDDHNPILVDPLGPGVRWRSLGPAAAPKGSRYGARVLHHGRDSRVVEVLVPPPRRASVVVKVHAGRPGQSRPPAERARREYELLRRFSRAGAAGPGVPGPAHVDEDAGVVVMEACRGRGLDDLLRSARACGEPGGDARAAAAMEETGRWVRRLQRVTAGEVDGAEAVEAWRESALEDAARCAGRVPAELLSRAALRVRATAADPARLGPVGQHGDLWPGNVLVCSDGVRVVDFEGYRPGLAAEDPAYFLLQAELFFDAPLLRGRFEPLRRAFLRGLGDEALEETGIYRLCRTTACLRTLSRHARRDRRRRRLVTAMEDSLR